MSDKPNLLEIGSGGQAGPKITDRSTGRDRGLLSGSDRHRFWTLRSVTTFRHDYTVFEFADQTVTGGALQGVNTIIESSGGPFKESS